MIIIKQKGITVFRRMFEQNRHTKLYVTTLYVTGKTFV